ncbi:MAG: TlpA disulfide reductase family protein [Granulosicoccaceae bacterium]
MQFLKNRAALAAVTLLAAVTVWYWIVPSSAQAAPNVTFNTLDGQQIELEQLRGRPVLVNFWATTCPSCMEEMPHLMELYDELHPDGFEMVGVAMAYDPPNQVLELSEAVKLPYNISLDIDYAIADAFGDVRLTPTSFLIDPEGKIVLHKLGMLDMSSLRKQIKTYL